MEGERKQVTVLLADLKGSMELLADRDPEEARALLDPVLATMMEAVHRYEGTVNQVMGDGIMALFGAPLAHEDHALRACYAALRMQERVTRLGDEMQRAHGAPVQIRVGLNSGEVVVRSIGSDLHMDYSAVGQTTHLAARMEQMAKPGSTLLTLATLRLVEGHVDVRPLGPVAVKGLPEPVEVFELIGARVGRTRLQAAATRGLTEFTGRHAELDLLRGALERARGGRGEVAAVVGEPGVGKSRLAWELVRSHRTAGWLVLEASSLAYGKARALQPVIDLLRAYFRLDDADDGRRVREKVTGRILTLDEGLRPALPVFQALVDAGEEDAEWARLGEEARRRRTAEAIRQLVLRESEVQPVLLLFEDLHWADPETQALLDLLVESLPSSRVLLLVNYRPGYQHGWGGKTYYSQVRLDPLPPETAGAILAALLGKDPSVAPLAAALIERAQGNPLFLEESVRALAEAGTLLGERGAYRLAQSPAHVVQVPATVQAILAARIDRLAPEDKSLLQCASVVGKDFPRSLLAPVAEVPEEELARGLDRLQAAEFVYATRLFPDAEYTFKHALTHEVAYGSLLHERRRALHARVVETVERRFADRLPEHRERLVHHAFRGELWSKALHYLRGGDDVATPEQVGEVMGSGPESPGRLWWAGEHAHAVRVAERDAAVGASFGNLAMRVVAICRLGQAQHSLGNFAMATDLLLQVVTSVGGDLAREHFGMAGYPVVFARSWLAWCLAEQGRFAEGAALGEEGVQLAEAAGEPYSRAHITFGLGTLHVIQGRPDLAIPLLERGLVVARLSNIPLLLPFISAPLGAAHALQGEVNRAVPLLEQAVEQGASMRLMAHHARRLVWLGHAYLQAGHHDRALAQARRALELAVQLEERAQQAYAHHLLAGIAASGGGPPGAAGDAYRQALGLAEPLGMRPLAALCHLGLGKLGLGAGDHAQARTDLAAAADALRELEMPLWLAEAEAALRGAGEPPG